MTSAQKGGLKLIYIKYNPKRGVGGGLEGSKILKYFEDVIYVWYAGFYLCHNHPA